MLTPFVDDPDFQLFVGDVRDVLREMEDGSVHCCVTSPPYWGLRDYGVEGQLGLEATPEEYVASMVAVFREVRRVLRDDGTLWLNLGDSYVSSPRGNAPGDFSTSSLTNPQRQDSIARPQGATSQRAGRSNVEEQRSVQRKIDGLKTKDLVGIPWRVAFALQADGWYLRSDIIWAKSNPMPESVTDRPTKAHEYVFLLSKSARYFYDADAIAEPAAWDRWGDQTVGNGSMGWIPAKAKPKLTGGAYEPPGQTPHGNAREPRGKALTSPRNDGNTWNENNGRGFIPVSEKRNKRSVWSIPTRAYPEAHFAVFPEELVEPCIKAGCPEGGVCLDPFMGSGTTALVARRLGRKSVGIELNPTYAELAARRLQQLSLLA